MHVKLTKTVARAAAMTTVVAAGLGFAPAALATTASISVPCDASDLATAVGTAPTDSTLLLAPDCTYILTSALPTITDHLGFFGNDTTIERNVESSDFTIMTVGEGGVVLIHDVTFENGHSVDGPGHGGAIDNTGGSVTVTGGAFIDNSADISGGAIANQSGTLKVTGATFEDNGAESGGAVYNDDFATLIGCDFVDNGAGSGGAVYNDDLMHVSGSTFNDNGATDGGG